MSNDRRLVFLAVALGISVAVACGDGAGPASGSECTTAVTLTVGTGTTPVFGWTPACRLFLVLVEDTSGGFDQWGVESDSANGIAPPVTYGTIPPGASKQLTPPITLQAGHGYRVILFRFTGPGHEDGVLIAQKPFTP